MATGPVAPTAINAAAAMVAFTILSKWERLPLQS
jgi:hypothetical protein